MARYEFQLGVDAETADYLTHRLSIPLSEFSGEAGIYMYNCKPKYSGPKGSGWFELPLTLAQAAEFGQVFMVKSTGQFSWRGKIFKATRVGVTTDHYRPDIPICWVGTIVERSFKVSARRGQDSKVPTLNSSVAAPAEGQDKKGETEPGETDAPLCPAGLVRCNSTMLETSAQSGSPAANRSLD